MREARRSNHQIVFNTRSRLCPASRELLQRVVKIVDRQADVLEVVLALGAAGRFAGGLNRRQQQRDQDADDRDDDQQFDERKAAVAIKGATPDAETGIRAARLAAWLRCSPSLASAFAFSWEESFAKRHAHFSVVGQFALSGRRTATSAIVPRSDGESPWQQQPGSRFGHGAAAAPAPSWRSARIHQQKTTSGRIAAPASDSGRHRSWTPGLERSPFQQALPH